MDLPFIWAGIIASAVMLYVLLDGFDLGVGILFGFAANDHERNLLTASIEPVWDGNETWLVLGGGGLLAAFPLAYAILMPAFYLPVTIMLIALIFRGVAFEFRHKAARPATRRFWNGAFAGGSLAAALAQGLILGGFVQGVSISGDAFSGGAFDFLTPFSVLVALSLAWGYVLLGACWLILKTDGQPREDARKWARRATIAVAISMAGVSLATLAIDPRVSASWGVSMSAIDFSVFWKVALVPIAAAALLALLWRDIARASKAPDWRPYLFAAGIFLAGFIGLAISIFPYNVPYAKTVWETAAHNNALALMLAGAGLMIPIILFYTYYVYRLFWGKVRGDEGYHA